MPTLPADRGLAELGQKADEAARVLKALANEKRLMILCRLLAAGEMSVLPLAEAVGLSQSALSQHLARMRMDRILACRRDGQTMHYRLADPAVARILKTLNALYC